MRISKSTKTDVKVCASLEGKTVKIKPYAEIKDMGWFVDDMKPYCGRTCEVIHDLANGFVQLDEIDFENRKLRQWEWSPEGLDVIENTNSSTSTDKALQHIKAAIDILGTSGDKSDVTKDSIANLSVVMFDLKGKK